MSHDTSRARVRFADATATFIALASDSQRVTRMVTVNMASNNAPIRSLSLATIASCIASHHAACIKCPHSSFKLAGCSPVLGDTTSVGALDSCLKCHREKNPAMMMRAWIKGALACVNWFQLPRWIGHVALASVSRGTSPSAVSGKLSTGLQDIQKPLPPASYNALVRSLWTALSFFHISLYEHTFLLLLPFVAVPDVTVALDCSGIANGGTESKSFTSF